MNYNFLWQSITLTYVITLVFVLFVVWVTLIYHTAFDSYRTSPNIARIGPFYLRVLPLIGACVFFVLLADGRYRAQIEIQMMLLCWLGFLQMHVAHTFKVVNNKEFLSTNTDVRNMRANTSYYHFFRDLICGLATGALTASHYLDDGAASITITIILMLAFDTLIEYKYGRSRAAGETRKAMQIKLYTSICTMVVGFLAAMVVSIGAAEEPTAFMMFVGLVMLVAMCFSRAFTIDTVEKTYYSN